MPGAAAAGLLVPGCNLRGCSPGLLRAIDDGVQGGPPDLGGHAADRDPAVMGLSSSFGPTTIRRLVAGSVCFAVDHNDVHYVSIGAA